MSFNKANSDVLAVAYGSKVNNGNNNNNNQRASTPHTGGGAVASNVGASSLDGERKDEQQMKDEGGLVAFWSLRNPQ
jgi:hypothetical protein